MSNDEMRFCSQSVENTSQLYCNISSTDDGDSLGLFFYIKETIRVDSVRSTRDLFVRRDRCSTSNSDCDLFSFDVVRASIVGCDLEFVRGDEGGVSFVVVDFVVDQILLAIDDGLSVTVLGEFVDAVEEGKGREGAY